MCETEVRIVLHPTNARGPCVVVAVGSHARRLFPRVRVSGFLTELTADIKVVGDESPTAFFEWLVRSVQSGQPSRTDVLLNDSQLGEAWMWPSVGSLFFALGAETERAVARRAILSSGSGSDQSVEYTLDATTGLPTQYHSGVAGIFGYPHEQWMRMPLDLFVPLVAQRRAMEEAIRNPGSRIVDAVVTHAEGHHVAVRFAVSSTLDGAVTVVAVPLYRISHSDGMQLIAAGAGRGDPGAGADNSSDSSAGAETSALDLEILAANHDAKVSVSSIQGYVRLLRETCDLSPDAHRLVGSIARSSAYAALALARNVLALSRTTPDSLTDLDRFVYVDRTVAHCVRVLRGLGAEKNVTISHVESPTVTNAGYELRNSRLRLEQALMTLIANAVEASRPDSIVSVLSETRDRGRKIVITVEDQGHGMDPMEIRHIEHIWKSKITSSGRSESDSDSDDSPVTGRSGLRICAHVVRELGGEIRLESKLSGTRVQIHVPAEPKTGESLPVLEQDSETESLPGNDPPDAVGEAVLRGASLLGSDVRFGVSRVFGDDTYPTARKRAQS